MKCTARHCKVGIIIRNLGLLARFNGLLAKFTRKRYIY